MNLRAQLPAFFAGAISMLVGVAVLHGGGLQTGRAAPMETPADQLKNNWPFFTLAAGPKSAQAEALITAFIRDKALPYERVTLVNAQGYRGFSFRLKISDQEAFAIEQHPSDRSIDFNYQSTETQGPGHRLAREQADLWAGFVNEQFPDHAIQEMLLGKQIARYSRPAKGIGN